jgi:hypothetical protein
VSATLKAGLIGAAVAAVLALLGLIPCLGCIASLLALVLYAGVGVLTARWLEPPRDAGKAAGRGAVAGLIAALGWGITNLIINVIRFSVGNTQAALMRQFRQLPPQLRDTWRDLGVDPSMLASPLVNVGGSALCCGIAVVLAAALGAAGAAIAVSLQREPEGSI